MNEPIGLQRAKPVEAAMIRYTHRPAPYLAMLGVLGQLSSRAWIGAEVVRAPWMKIVSDASGIVLAPAVMLMVRGVTRRRGVCTRRAG